jgi:hypothetical protein
MAIHNAPLGYLLAIFLFANLIAAFGHRAFSTGRTLQRRVIDTVAFILWGSIIVVGLWLIETIKRFNEWAV